MPLNRYVVRVDPQGQSVTVDILDTSGVSVVVYDSSQFAAVPRTLPMVITTQTDFWLRDPGPYDVSCKVGGAEVADAGAPKRVQVSDVPVLVVPDWERERTASSGGSIPVAKITGELLLTGAQMVSNGSGLGGYQVVAADMTLTEIQGTSGVTIGDWPGDPTIGAVLLNEPGDYDYALYVSPTLTPDTGVTTLRSLGVGFAGGGVGNSAGLDATFPLPANNLIQQTVRGLPAWSVPGSGLANSALQAPFFFLFDGSATDALDISFILHVWKM